MSYQPTCPRRRAVGLAATLAVAVLAAALAGRASADDAAVDPPDTSNWKCTQCPFFQGNSGEVQAGVLDADGANAASGRYTGIDHNGAYADASAQGQWRDHDGTYAQYQLDNLGLPSRDGYVDAGQEGRYDLQLNYSGQPTRLYDTTATPYRGVGSTSLTLPEGWTGANSTAGMTQLGSSLSPVDLGYQRNTVSLLGRVFAGTSWTVYTDLSHQQKTGTDLTSASFLTEAVQMPEPIDYETNTLEGGASWAGRSASLHAAYTGSWFQDNNDALTWQNPYSPLIAGSSFGRLALPPSNNLQQGSLSGQARLPVFAATTLTYSASLGRLSQDAAFLPTSTLPGATVPAPGSLLGDVQLSHYALALASRVSSQLYVRGTASYDGRDDHTNALTIAQTITDELPGGTATTPRYGEDRTRLDGSADYRWFRWLKFGIAGDYLHTHFAPGQVVDYTDDSRGWAHLSVTPLPALSFDLKGGTDERTASSFNLAALPLGENPLLRGYEYAARDENFFDLSGSWSVTATLAWALQGTWSDEAYRLSQLGLQGGHQRNLSTTITWAPVPAASLYVDGSYQRLTALQSGTIESGAPVWQVSDAQYFWTTGAGGQWVIGPRWALSLDYEHAITRGDDAIAQGSPTQYFPEVRSSLSSLSLNATYQWTRALRVRLRDAYKNYGSNDWALDEVYAATVPNLLALGAQPYRYNVNLIALTVLYRFGAEAAGVAQ